MDILIRMKFWFGVGAVALIAVVLFLIGPCSLMSANSSRFEELQDRAQDLRRHARKKVKNEKWVEQQNEVKSNLQRQLLQVQEELLSRDALLEEHLKDPATGTPGPLSFGRFPAAYQEAMNELQSKLKDNVIKITSDAPLVEKKLGSEWLPQSVLHGYEKQVQVQEAVVNAITDLNSEADVVPVFHTFRFEKKPQRFMSPAHATQFDAIPFELQVALEFEFYPLFLERIMRIPLDPEITSVRIRRYTEGKDNATRPSSNRMAEDPSEKADSSDNEEGVDEYGGKTIAQDLVFVVVKGYIPDYVEKKKEDDADGDSDRRRRRR